MRESSQSPGSPEGRRCFRVKSAFSWCCFRLRQSETVSSLKNPGRAPALKLGVASYSLAKLPVEEVIAALKQMEITAVSLYKSHAPWADGTPDQCRAVVQKFSDAGITVTSTGMIELPNDEAVIRKALDNVQGSRTYNLLRLAKAHRLAATG